MKKMLAAALLLGGAVLLGTAPLAHADGPTVGSPCPKDDPEMIFGSDGTTKVRCTDGRWVVDRGTGDMTTRVDTPCFGYQNDEVTSTWDGTKLRCFSGRWLPDSPNLPPPGYTGNW